MEATERSVQLADLFELVATAVPDRTALVWGPIRRTYRELDDRSTRLAHHLADRAGVGTGDHVAVYAQNRPEWIEAMLAAFKLRAVPVNVNFRYVAGELAYLLDNADAVAVITEAPYLPTLGQVRASVPSLRHVICTDSDTAPDPDGFDADFETAIANAADDPDFEPRSADDRYLLYTGGTTGQPKGTVWRHVDILHAALQGGRPIGEPITRPEEVLDNLAHEPGVFLVTAPLMHASGQWATLIGLLTGACVVLLDGGFDPERLWTLVDREGVQIVNLVGDAMVRPVLDTLAANPERWDVSTVFVLSSGGAVLSPSVKAEVGRLLPGALVIDGFGASETGNNGKSMGVGDDGRARFQLDAWTAVLDDELRPLPPGSDVVGRLAKRGPIPLGYYKDERKTAETFVEVDGERWVIPGDHARVEADGTVVVLGRGSVSINTGGEKVFPEEVEAAVKSHPAIYDAVVVGVPSERWGEEVVAVASLRADATLTLDALADHLRGELAGYKLPRHLVVVDIVTRTATGKPDYPWAKATAAARVGAD